MKLFLLFLLLFVAGCTQPDKATIALQRDGYTEIQITGYSWFGCGKDDDFSTGFIAKKNGKQVTGVYCSGWWKGGTIRTFD